MFDIIVVVVFVSPFFLLNFFSVVVGGGGGGILGGVMHQDTNNENLEKLLKQHSTMFDLCGPMKGCAAPHERHLFMEGDLRFKDSTTKVIGYTQCI